MAVAFEGFCIREFASKMRSVDVVKSWPFGGDSDFEQIESALPPITVAKFRWWQHELEASRSSHARSSDAAAHLEEEKSEEPPFGCTVCGGFKTASGNENAATRPEIGNFEKQQSTRSRSKSKAPKKRSIVEIFAVAPPIDTVRNSDSTRVNKKKKKNAALKKRHLPILDSKLKKKKVRRNASFAMKSLQEIFHKLKRKSASDLSRNFDRLRDKMCTSGKLEDADGTHISNQSCKPSSSHKKHKNIAPSKFISKMHNTVVTPVRGILKKKRKYFLDKGTAATVPEENSQAADQVEKHVSFLVENDKRDSEANTHAVTQQSNLQKFFTGVDRLGRNEVEVETVSENENSICLKELHVGKEKEITLTDTCSQGNLKNYLKVGTFQEDLNNFPELPTSPNHHTPKFCGDLNRSTKGKSIVSDDASYPWHSNADKAGSSVRPFSFRSEFISNQQVGPSRAAYAASSVPRIANTSLQSASLSSLLLNENLKDQRLACPSQSMMSDSSFIPPLYQPASRPHQIGSSFSYKEWNPIGATSSEKSLNENLYGLPLNSRGELIHLSSSGNVVLDEQSGPLRRFPCQTAVQQRHAEDSIRFKGNHTDERSIPKDLNLFPIHVYADGTPSSIPSRNGMAEKRGTIMENSSSHLFGRDLNLLSSPSVQGTKVVGATNTPPVTMRLMGKDVCIDRNSRIRCEEEKVWMDKEIIVEHNNPCGTRYFFPQEPVMNSVPEKSSGLVNISFGGLNNSEYYRFPPPRVRDPYTNWQPADAAIGRVPVFHIESVRDPERLRLGSQMHESNWIDIQWGPDTMYRQNNVHLPRVIPNSFGFPPDDCRECSYWCRNNNSFKEVVPPPPWLLRATSDQRNTAYTNHGALAPFPDRQQQQHLYGAPPPANRTAFHLPEPYYSSYNPMALQSQMRRRRRRSPVGVENVHHNNYGVDTGGFGFRDQTRASKRPAAVFDVDQRKPCKVPTLELQVLHPSIDLSLARENTTGRNNVEHCGAVVELENGNESNIGLERNQQVSDRLKPSPGPTKLRAGAKHILKPCQKNTDNPACSTGGSK